MGLVFFMNRSAKSYDLYWYSSEVLKRKLNSIEVIDFNDFGYDFIRKFEFTILCGKSVYANIFRLILQKLFCAIYLNKSDILTISCNSNILYIITLQFNK